MRIKRGLISVLLCSAIVFSAGFLEAVDLYWVAFNGTGGTFKFLMQIDQNGNVTKPATAILDYNIAATGTEPQNPFANDTSQEDQIQGPLAGPCAIAISDKSSTELFMWLTTVQGSLFKYTINKSTMNPTTAMPVAIATRGFEEQTRDFRSMQATQHTSNRFLAINFGTIGSESCSTDPISTAYEIDCDNIRGRTYAFGYNPTNGTLDGTSKSITPRTRNNDKLIGVSADGLMAITSVEIGQLDEQFTFSGTGFVGLDTDRADKVYVQPLTANRGTNGDPKVVGETDPQTGPVDVSNPLAGGKRFVIFATRSTDDPDTSNEDNLILQPINAVNGDKLGGPKILQTNREMVMTWWQGLAIDPLGRFVLFTQREFLSPPVNNDTDTGDEGRDDLWYLALDANGNAVGAKKLIFSADDGPATGEEDEASGNEYAIPQVTGIDILLN